MRRCVWLALLIAVTAVTNVRAERIDFSSLNSQNVSDGDGQTFAWAGGGQSGTVVVRANWPNVLPIDGALRTDTPGGASLGSPFTGSLSITFSQPVEIMLRSTFPSLLRDGQNGGRFERVQLSSAPPETFSPLGGTTAIYTGIGTSTIVADDEFSQLPTVSNWGFVGSGAASSYQFQYTSTSFGLSETFDVIVVPEPASAVLCSVGLAMGVGIRLRKTSARLLLVAGTRRARTVRAM